jgi:hypothetical protein
MVYDVLEGKIVTERNVIRVTSRVSYGSKQSNRDLEA